MFGPSEVGILHVREEQLDITWLDAVSATPYAVQVGKTVSLCLDRRVRRTSDTVQGFCKSPRQSSFHPHADGALASDVALVA
jgi:hypothetical protein